MTSSEPPCMVAALFLAARGFTVFPIHGVRTDLTCTCSKPECDNIGKHPRTPHGFKDATTEAATIRQWWSQWADSNVGIATEGELVLDRDPRHGGDASLARLETEHGALPATVTAQTGGGGAHYHFRPRPGQAARCRIGFRPGLDIRATGGYVVAPPSRHESGSSYEWVPGCAPGEVGMAVAPQWLADVASATGSASSELPGGSRAHPLVDQLNTEGVGSSDLMRRALAYAQRVPAATKGERNKTAFSLAGHLAAIADEYGSCLSEATILEVVATWNARLSEPLGADELSKAVHSALHNGTPREPKQSSKTKTADNRGVGQPAQGATDQPRPNSDDGQPRKLTDTGNAERFVDRFGISVRYCHPWKKWLIWNGKLWRIDDCGRAMSLSKEVVRGLYVEATTVPDKLRDSFLEFAHKSEKADRRKALVELAKSERGIPILHEQFDCDPWLFNCSSGTIDLRTGALRPHRREDYLTKISPIAYDEDAKCDLWIQFLERVVPDAKVRAYLQRAVGYSLTGDVGEQVLFFLTGGGANGKSTFLGLIQKMLGPYAIQAASDLLLQKPGQSHPTELADLFATRMAVCMEMGSDRAFNETLIKQLTGEDRIRARRMREDFWEFSPTHKLWLGANHRPRITGTDEAIWRRFHVVPFPVFIPKNQRDKKLISKLKKELPGILRWAVEGCLEWQRDGLNPPDQVLQTVADYREEMDAVGQFLEQRCEFTPKGSAQASEIYAAYLAWCKDTDTRPVSQKELSNRLTDRGAESKKRGTKYYEGVRVLSESEVRGPCGPSGPCSGMNASGVPREGVNQEPGPHGPQRPENGPCDPEKADCSDTSRNGNCANQGVEKEALGIDVDPDLPEMDGLPVLRRVGIDGHLATENGQVVRFSSLTLLGNDRYLTSTGRDVRILDAEGCTHG